MSIDGRRRDASLGSADLPALAAARASRILDDSRRLVECESPSHDLGAVARSGAIVAAVGSHAMGERAEALVIDGVTHVRWRLGSGPGRVLVLGHHDTVWPIGTLERLPWRFDGTHVRGPGTVDMKVGLAQGFHAIAVLRASGMSLDGVTVLVTGDEEVGSPSSRSLIEDEARQADAVLVLEGAGTSGAVKTGRKGTANYRIEVIGRAAHAGVEPEHGANATIELAHRIVELEGLNEFGRTTVVPTVLRGGTTRNTVPDRASVEVDVRAWTVEEQHRIDARIHALAAEHPGCRVLVSGGPNRPPMEPGQATGLFAAAQAVARRYGLPELREILVGGASDGNFTAAVGTPTLDGLGAVGGGAHADGEHVLVSAVPERTALLAGLIHALG